MNLISRFSKSPGPKLLIIISSILIISVALSINFCSGETTAKPELGPVVEAVYALGTVKTDKYIMPVSE